METDNQRETFRELHSIHGRYFEVQFSLGDPVFQLVIPADFRRWFRWPGLEHCTLLTSLFSPRE
ncbi:hypothetical protein KC19_VG266300 [Ceratodon purpureus]|uniref:Uncharacterized protein n=1 Tax=Ceratodon purpureus TaxID=3225 RepID=A0A8T0HUM3_CERPU|nr:hypothetical protein KC19_VG266300 [Ceratodon purpureus]